MTTITAQEEITLRRKLGNNGAGFSTPDLDAIWVEGGESMTQAIFICFEELLNDTARFNDYTQNDSSERRSQIHDHIAKNVLPYWLKKALLENTEDNRHLRAVKIMGIRRVPPSHMDRPATDPQTSDPFLRRRSGAGGEDNG